MLKLLRSPTGVFGVSVVLISCLAPVVAPAFVKTLFSSGFFMPHVHCYLDDPRMVWLQGLSDLLIGASYMLISGTLAYLVYRAHHDIPFEWVFLAFGIFIFSCGWTHFMEVWTLWHPTYWLSGGVKSLTALSSLSTAAGLIWLFPHILRFIHAAKISEQRRQELIKTNAQLTRAYQDLQAFSYSLSHDIQGPLRAVKSFSRLFVQDHGETSDPEGLDLVKRIGAASDRMDRLVQDVLTLSRLAKAPENLESMDPEPLLKEVLQSRPEFQLPAAQIQIQPSFPRVMGDRWSLSQCLDNLLSNAVKFVAPGVTPVVRLRHERRDNVVRIWVEDNGIGIPTRYQQKIFEPFQRLHHEREYPGTGVGLAIVQKAVERIGGQVGVESESNQGSRFWIDLQAG